MASKSLGLPPTRQSLVVVNGRLDRNTYSERSSKKDNEKAVRLGFGSETDHGIATHELCFSNISVHPGIRFNEPEIAVFSSFNGFKHEANKKDEEQVRFIGVSQTTIPKPFHGNGHLSMSAGGVVRIFNTGKDPFEIGDKVMWSIPTDSNDQTPIRDISTSKIYPVVKPYGIPDSKKISHDVFVNKTMSCNTPDEQQKLVKEILKHVRSEESRVIGIALSRAQKGEAFDVLLRYN